MSLYKLKQSLLIIFGFVFIFTPSQNWYISVPLIPQPAEVDAFEFPLPLPANYPTAEKQTDLNLTAKSIMVLDVDSGVTLYKKNEKAILLPASTVKMMTALVAAEYFDKNQIIKVGKITTWGQRIKLFEGEQFTVEQILYGLLVASANDAAEVLAANYPGGELQFIEAMNKKAEELHLEQTKFTNPSGLDSNKDGLPLVTRSYSSALDLARLGREVIKNDNLRQIVSTQETEIKDQTGVFKHQFANINVLLNRRPEIKGIKTGWTEDAGECLVGYVERNGQKIITVIMGSADRFGETEALVDYIFANYNWEPIAGT